jgi:hypothetical protein
VCKKVIEIDSEECDDAALEDVGKDVIWEMAEWGWKILPE